VFGHDAYPDVDTQAAALMHSLIRNHPFIDGNKRTALIAVLMFYGLNGMWVDAEQDELIALAVDVAKGILDVTAIAGLLKGWVTHGGFSASPMPIICTPWITAARSNRRSGRLCTGTDAISLPRERRGTERGAGSGRRAILPYRCRG
jgi:Fic/DOC family protein